jgi:hypothetical protein
MKSIFKGLIKRKGQKEEKQVKTTTTAANMKCKECGMQFQSKDNLQVHKKKAHSGREEKGLNAFVIKVTLSLSFVLSFFKSSYHFLPLLSLCSYVRKT